MCFETAAQATPSLDWIKKLMFSVIEDTGVRGWILLATAFRRVQIFRLVPAILMTPSSTSTAANANWQMAACSHNSKPAVGNITGLTEQLVWAVHSSFVSSVFFLVDPVKQNSAWFNFTCEDCLAQYYKMFLLQSCCQAHVQISWICVEDVMVVTRGD